MKQFSNYITDDGVDLINQEDPKNWDTEPSKLRDAEGYEYTRLQPFELSKKVYRDVTYRETRVGGVFVYQWLGQRFVYQVPEKGFWDGEMVSYTGAGDKYDIQIQGISVYRDGYVVVQHQESPRDHICLHFSILPLAIREFIGSDFCQWAIGPDTHSQSKTFYVDPISAKKFIKEVTK